MTSLKKVSLLALAMIVLIMPVIAMSDDASGEVSLYDDDVWVSKGFDDRTNGIISVRLFNAGTDEVAITVSIGNVEGITYISRDLNLQPEEVRTETLSFRITEPGTYYLEVIVTGEEDAVTEQNRQTLTIIVDRSIWSNTWTYVAIIIVIIIVAIAAFIKMRGTPRGADEAGTFTAMEEERKAGKKRSGTDREEYKGRKKKE